MYLRTCQHLKQTNKNPQDGRLDLLSKYIQEIGTLGKLWKRETAVAPYIF